MSRFFAGVKTRMRRRNRRLKLGEHQFDYLGVCGMRDLGPMLINAGARHVFVKKGVVPELVAACPALSMHHGK